MSMPKFRSGGLRVADNGWALAKAALKPLDLCRDLSAAFANAMLLAGGIFSTKLKLKY